jgi:hypothetical protein
VADLPALPPKQARAALHSVQADQQHLAAIEAAEEAEAAAAPHLEVGDRVVLTRAVRSLPAGHPALVVVALDGDPDVTIQPQGKYKAASTLWALRLPRTWVERTGHDSRYELNPRDGEDAPRCR